MNGPPVALQAALEKHRKGLDQHLATLEVAVTSMASDELDEVLRAEAERAAHKLAGSLGTFGFPRGSELALELEGVFATEGGPAAEEMPRLAEIVLDLQAQLQPGLATDGQPPAGEGRPAPEGLAVLFVSPDPELKDRLTVAALGHGLRPRSAVTCTGARRLAVDETPDAVVLDVSFGDANTEGLDLLEEFARRDPPVPVLVLTASEALVDRVEVAHRGGEAFMQRTRPVGEMIAAVLSQIEHAEPTQAKVLAVDDDEAILDVLEVLLKPSGIEVIPLSDPVRFWHVLTATTPDLLLLDLDMPSHSGIDLCQAVRADERFGQLPIIFLSATTDAKRIQEIFEAGADDYVTKPIVGPELGARVLNRLERVRVYRDLAENDALTGTASRRRATFAIEDSFIAASRHDQPVSLALIDLDHFDRFNDSVAERTGDAVLRGLGDRVTAAFGASDVVGRWGDDEFIVAAYGMTRDDGVQRVADVLEAFRQERYTNAEGRSDQVSFSAGVAEYPRDGGDLQELAAVAASALGHAKANGGDCVTPVDSPAAAAAKSQPDVVVVDDDEVLAELLLDSLQTRGYRTLRFSDGQEAAEALSGSPPSVSPALVLMDVDLPGMDGISVLRKLAKEGVLSRTGVIMLTAHAGEAEVMEALELGAIDHVAKPFSLPVLMQRVRRALKR